MKSITNDHQRHGLGVSCFNICLLIVTDLLRQGFPKSSYHVVSISNLSPCHHLPHPSFDSLPTSSHLITSHPASAIHSPFPPPKYPLLSPSSLLLIMWKPYIVLSPTISPCLPAQESSDHGPKAYVKNVGVFVVSMACRCRCRCVEVGPAPPRLGCGRCRRQTGSGFVSVLVARW